MIHSMTGFGSAEGIVAEKKINVQLKSLNGKHSDISIKVPNGFKERELIYRKILSDQIGRGKVEMYLNYVDEADVNAYKIDEKTYLRYYQQLKSVHSKIDVPLDNISATICRLPDVLISESEEFSESEWEKVNDIIKEAANALINFRITEGEQLYKDLRSHIDAINALLSEALVYEDERLETVRARLQKNLEEAQQKEKVDSDRFEQELIYYMEKYDISEEKVRLQVHCKHFIETMDEVAGQGKKLGFITQEIGREINTLGSKANHAEMQKIVVEMKDRLEKIKEQILNVW